MKSHGLFIKPTFDAFIVYTVYPPTSFSLTLRYIPNMTRYNGSPIQIYFLFFQDDLGCVHIARKPYYRMYFPDTLYNIFLVVERDHRNQVFGIRFLCSCIGLGLQFVFVSLPVVKM